ERAVAGALADAIDRAFDLACAGEHRREAVGHRHAQIVMTMHRERYAIDAAYMLTQVAEQLSELIGYRITDGVRDVDGRGTGLDDGLHDLGEEIELGARGVLG